MAARLLGEWCLQLAFLPHFFFYRLLGFFFRDLCCGYHVPGSVASLHASPGGSSLFQGTVAAPFSSKPHFLGPNVTGDPQPRAQPHLLAHPRTQPWFLQRFWVPGLRSHPAPVAITVNEGLAVVIWKHVLWGLLAIRVSPQLPSLLAALC